MKHIEHPDIGWYMPRDQEKEREQPCCPCCNMFCSYVYFHRETKEIVGCDECVVVYNANEKI